MTKLLKLLMAVGPLLVGAGHWVPGDSGQVLAILGVAVTGLAALFHPTPAAVAAFGPAAK